jgi:hypothetical protein
MRKAMVSLVGLAAGLMVLSSLTGAQETEKKEAPNEQKPAAEQKATKEKEAAPQHEFVGVATCKMCHHAASKGDQYGKWLASPHAKAYEVLGTDAAKATAAKVGLKGNPQEADECLGCHVTAHGVKAELLGAKYKVEDGVGCESCHGAGGDYKSMKVMKDKDAAIAAGLVMPTAETCKGCHNEKSPNFKGFDFAKMFPLIAHPYPKAEEGK